MPEPDRTDGTAAGPAVPGRARLAGLDGLRALAVAAVITYHVDARWLPGGYVGVDVFFGISGFLITHLLLAEHARTGRIALGGFWRRRAVRLLPELLLVLLACAVAARLTAGDGTGIGDGLRGDALACLAFVNNWWQIHEGADYFHHLGTPPLLQHLWSLSVEEQFYLVWPLVLAACLAAGRGKRWVRGLLGAAAAAGAAASLWRMHELAHGASGVSRAYFGTDSHSGALLTGCATALLLPALRKAAALLPGRGVMAARAALVVLAVLAVGGFGDAAMYGWGFSALALATAVVCTACALGAPPRLLERSVPRVLGRHSYGLYLWHWPLVVAGNALWPTAGAPVRAVEILAPLPLAVAGRRLVQRPVAGLVRRPRPATGRPRSAVPIATVAGLAAVAALVVSPVSAPSALQNQLRAAARYEAALSHDDGRAPAGRSGTGHAAPPGPSAGASAQPGASAPAATASAAPPADGGGEAKADGSDVTMIGDSISLGSAPDLHRVLPGIDLHAEVGRMMEDAPGICAQLLARHELRGTVVLALGTNAEFGADVLDHIRSVIGQRRMVLMTVRGPFSWQDTVNNVVLDYRHDHPQVLVDDWYDTIQAHQDLLWIDHVHPRGGAGTALFAASVADTLAADPRS